MAKDYVRRRESRKRSNAPRQFLLVLASFLGGYLTATVFDFTSLTAWINKQVLAHQNPQQPEIKPVAKKPEPPKPKFEFYTLLAKDSSVPTVNRPLPATVAKANPSTVEPMTNPSAASVSTTNPHPLDIGVVESKPVTASANPAAHGKESYLLQIASFNKRPDAEHLKASLTLHGFDVIISPTAHGNVTWYRVIVGPFNSRSDAEKAQITVAKSERMKGMIRKMDA